MNTVEIVTLIGALAATGGLALVWHRLTSASKRSRDAFNTNEIEFTGTSDPILFVTPENAEWDERDNAEDLDTIGQQWDTAAPPSDPPTHSVTRPVMPPNIEVPGSLFASSGDVLSAQGFEQLRQAFMRSWNRADMSSPNRVDQARPEAAPPRAPRQHVVRAKTMEEFFAKREAMNRIENTVFLPPVNANNCTHDWVILTHTPSGDRIRRCSMCNAIESIPACVHAWVEGEILRINSKNLAKKMTCSKCGKTELKAIQHKTIKELRQNVTRSMILED